MKKKIGILVLVLVIVIAIFFGCRGTAKGTGDVMENISIVEQKDIENVVYVNGKMVTQTIRNVSVEKDRIVQKVFVKIGDKVKKGDLLVEMNKEDLVNALNVKKMKLDIEQAKLNKLKKNSDVKLMNDLKKAESVVDNAMKEKENKKLLLDAGAASKKQYEITVSAYENAKIAYENAKYGVSNSSRTYDLFVQQKNIEIFKNEIGELEKKIAKTVVVAPIDGTVTENNGIEGEICNKNLITLSDLDNNVIKANVSEVDINKIKLGQKVKITANSAKGKQFLGKVMFISPSSKIIEGKKQAYVEVKVSLDKMASELKNNFSVNMEIVIESKKNAKVISIDAINEDENGEEYINLINSDGTIKKVMINQGISNDIFVELLNEEVNVLDKIQIQSLDSNEDNEGTMVVF